MAMKEFLQDLLGAENVLDDAAEMTEYREDYTEVDPVDPALVAFVTEVEQVQAVVKKCGEEGMPITPRMAGTNIGGLAIPAEGGLVLDMSRMNKVIEVNADDMYAVIEPGVTQQQMKDYLIDNDLPLTLGYSLAPPHTSVAVNAIMGGLTNRSLKYGDQSDWLSGLEVVLPDGELMRTGAWALSDVAFGRVPFPDLTGLFVGWQGTTGIATKVVFQLWPKHPLNKRLFILSYSIEGTYDAMRMLCRKEICDDIGGLSWPAGKMMLGVKHPDPVPTPGEPIFFLYVDVTAETEREMAAKEEILRDVLDQMTSAHGHKYEAPMEVENLVSLAPPLKLFADFPVDLEFLTNHGGGGLSWIGTYGPLSRFDVAANEGVEIMTEQGFPPLIVSRPMRGGHFGVLRLITIFDKQNPDEVEAVRKVNRDLLDMITKRGFIMYKTPIWAWRILKPQVDPGMVKMLSRVKQLLDPKGVLNPGKLEL